MSAVNLLQPILDGVQRNNFFNGRLLSAEDLRAEQVADRVQRGQLARAIGDGVAWGMSVDVTSAAQLKVMVRKGLAFNRHLDLLSLGDDTEVTLHEAPPTATATGTGVFAQCEPPRSSAAYTGAGVYLLVVAPASGYDGTALVSDPNATAVGRGSCGARFSVEGLCFRLVPMELQRLGGVDAGLVSRIGALLPPPNDASRERLRNLLAHLCHGTQQLGGYFTDPLAPNGAETAWSGWGAVDAMRDLGDITACDVPLAVVVLTSAGISFVDTWSVRRKLTGAGAVDTWRGVAGPRRVSEAESLFLQFQAQLKVVRTLASAPSITASTYFDVLPPAGWLPTGTSGFTWKTFLGAHAPDATTPVDAALLRGVIERSWFDEPFALATTPPVPLRVFEVPGAPYVVFARSALGAVRVTVSPAPAFGQTVEVTLTAATGGSVHGSAFVGDRITIPEVPPGRHSLSVSAPDFLPAAAFDVDVVGGRTTDATIALTPLSNGSILVDAIDNETDDRIASSKILSITASVGDETVEASPRDGKWEFADLPAGTYTVTGRAAGYLTASITLGPTAKGTVVEGVLRFVQIVKEPPPPECLSVTGVEQPRLTDVRLCMVLAAAEFGEGDYYTRAHREEGSAIASDAYRVKARRKGETERGSRYVAGSGEIVYRSEQRWKSMIKLSPVPEKAAKWLGQWADWLAQDLSMQSLRKSTPVIVVDPNYRLPRSAAQVPALPPAYALFDGLAIPLAIRAESGLTPLPVLLDSKVLPWVSAETIDALAAAGIRSLNQLAWTWSELVVDATGDAPETAPYLISDAMSAVEGINASRGYYPGLTPKMEAALKTSGYPTDHALANATPERIEKIVGSRGFAVRLIHEARKIVPRESWSVEALPLAPVQRANLILRGVDSQGELIERANDPAGKAVIADALGVLGQPAAKRDEAINPLVNEALAVLTRDAVMLAPTIPLSRWGGVDATTAAVLEANGITTVDELGRATEATIAEAGNLSASDAKALVGKAKKDSLAAASVDAVIGLASTTTSKLATAFGGEKPTLGVMLSSTTGTLKGAFGDEARAGSVLKGLSQGFAARGVIR